MRYGILALGLWLLVSVAVAQDGDLQARNIEIETRIDAFGLEEQIIVGEVRNTGDDAAYADIQVFATIRNDAGDDIGEAFGFVVDQCGEPILDFPLQPEQARRFVAPLDLYGEGEIDAIEVEAQGRVTEAEAPPQRDIDDAVTPVAGGEVVDVQWIDNETLRYGVGCDNALFTSYDWFEYDLTGAAATPIPLDEHPDAAAITDAFILQTGINQVTQSGATNDVLIQTSQLYFPPQTRRIVYQTDIHTVITAEIDGSFKRIVHPAASRYTLQGYVFSPEGSFVAYYFGAYGEMIRYFTASAVNNRISGVLENNTQSVTVPGLTDDGQRVIIGGTFPDNQGDEVTGYWFSSVINNAREFMFEVDELPGNHYPAPAYYRKDAETRYIYIVRPIDDVPTLQCFYREEGTLHTLTELPLQLATDERAWTWLSPDNTTLALAANGDHSGLWLIDLTAFDVCR